MDIRIFCKEIPNFGSLIKIELSTLQMLGYDTDKLQNAQTLPYELDNIITGLIDSGIIVRLSEDIDKVPIMASSNGYELCITFPPNTIRFLTPQEREQFLEYRKNLSSQKEEPIVDEPTENNPFSDELNEKTQEEVSEQPNEETIEAREKLMNILNTVDKFLGANATHPNNDNVVYTDNNNQTVENPLDKKMFIFKVTHRTLDDAIDTCKILKSHRIKIKESSLYKDTDEDNPKPYILYLKSLGRYCRTINAVLNEYHNKDEVSVKEETGFETFEEHATVITKENAVKKLAPLSSLEEDEEDKENENYEGEELC